MKVSFPGLGLAIVVVAMADLAGQDRKDPPPTARERQSLVALLDALDRGQAFNLTIQRPFNFHNTFQSVAIDWIEAATGADRERRRQVVAVAVLEAARGAAGGSTSSTTRAPALSLTSVRRLIEWQCDQFRRGPPTEFERRWLIASAALIQATGNARFMTGSSVTADIRSITINGRPVPGVAADVPCNTGDLEPCNHAAHIEARFPGLPEVALARIILESGAIGRRPGRLAGRIALSKVAEKSSVVPISPGLGKVVEAGLAQLRRLANDETVGWDARLRLGLTLYSLNDRPGSLQELATVGASSAKIELRYLAHFASALIHDADNHLAGTIASLEAAKALIPHVRSTATLLAAKYVLAGRQAEAFALMDDVYLADPPAFDPRLLRFGAWAIDKPYDKVREMIRR